MLSFSSLLVFFNNFLKSTLLLFIYQTMLLFHLLTLLVTQVSSEMKNFLMLKTSLLFLNHSSSVFVIHDGFAIKLITLLLLFLRLSFTPILTTATLFCSRTKTEDRERTTQFGSLFHYSMNFYFNSRVQFVMSHVIKMRDNCSLQL